MNENPLRPAALNNKTKMNAIEYVPLNMSNFEEDALIRMPGSNGIKMSLGCLYKDPSGSPFNSQLLVELFDCKDFSKFDFICIVGDINFSMIAWYNLCAVFCDDKKFIVALGEAYLSQLVGRPT